MHGKAFKFQNPLRQNYKHTKALEEPLDVPSELIHLIVTFVGNAEFNTPMPNTVTRGVGFVRHIKTFDQPAFAPTQVQSILARIESHRLTPSIATHKSHVQGLRSRH